MCQLHGEKNSATDISLSLD